VGFHRAVTTQIAATTARDLADECGFEVVDTEPGQPVTVLDHDRGNTWVGQQLTKRDPVPVHPETDLGAGRGEGDAACAAFPGDPTSLAFQVGALLGAGHPAVRHRRADRMAW
jgi:hypothetical protein